MASARRQLRELRAEHDAYVERMRTAFVTISAVTPAGEPDMLLLGPMPLELLDLWIGETAWSEVLAGPIEIRFVRRRG